MDTTQVKTKIRLNAAYKASSLGVVHTIRKDRLAFTFKGDRRPTAAYAKNSFSEKSMWFWRDEVFVNNLVVGIEAAFADDEGEGDPHVAAALLIGGVEPNPGPPHGAGGPRNRRPPPGQGQGRAQAHVHAVKQAHVDEVSRLQGEIDALKEKNAEKAKELADAREKEEKLRLAEDAAKVDERFAQIEKLDSTRWSRNNHFVSWWDPVLILIYVFLTLKVSYDLGAHGLYSMLLSFQCAFLRLCLEEDHFQWSHYLKSAVMTLLVYTIVLTMYAIFRSYIQQPFLSMRRRFISRVKFVGWVVDAEAKIDMRTAGMSMAEMKKKCRVAQFEMTVTRQLRFFGWSRPTSVLIDVSTEAITQCLSPHVTHWGLEPAMVKKKMEEVIRNFQDANFDRTRMPGGKLDMQDATIVAYELYLGNREKRSDLLFPRPSFI